MYLLKIMLKPVYLINSIQNTFWYSPEISVCPIHLYAIIYPSMIKSIKNML